MKHFSCFLFCICIFFSTAAFAFDSGEIIVTGTVEPIMSTQSGVNVIVVSQEEITKRKPTSLEELLRNIPSLTVISAGTGQLSVGIRGAPTGNTMVMLDGVPFQDPSMPRGVSLWMLPPSMIERVEIMPGPVSAMYGSGAMGGVINIITKKNTEGGDVSVGAGSYGMHRLDANASNKYLTVGGSYYYEKGTEDPFNTGIVYAKQYLDMGGYKHTIYGSISQTHYKYDNAASHTDQDLYQLTFSPAYTVNRYWTPQLHAGYTESFRNSSDEWADAYFRGLTIFTELDNRVTLLDRAFLSVGGKWSQDSADTSYIDTEKTDTWEGFLNGTFKPTDVWNVFLGGRYVSVDDKYENADKLVYSANSSYEIKAINLIIRGGYGTAFRNPSLDERYNIFWGNTDLKHEESTLWEAGFLHKFFDNMVTWGVTYFDSEFKNQIYYDSTANTMKNRMNSTSQGVEAELNVYASVFALNMSYTYADIKDRNNGVESKALRRPQNRAYGALSVFPFDGFSAKLEVVYSDKADDLLWDESTFTNVPVVNPAHTLVNFYISYDVNENFNVYGKVLNLTDESYTTVAGYENKRLDLQAGINIRL